MRRAFQIIGAILIVIAVFFMLTFIILPAVLPSYDSFPALKALDQMLFCKTGEKLDEVRDNYNPSPGTTVTTITLSCVNSRGQARDVSQAPIGVGAVGYLVPFLLGLFMVLGASSGKKQAAIDTSYRQALGKPHALNQAGMQGFVLPDGNFTAINSEGQIVMGKEADLDALSKHSPALAANLSRVNRLKELKAALEAGVITQEEYKAKHDEILKEM